MAKKSKLASMPKPRNSQAAALCDPHGPYRNKTIEDTRKNKRHPKHKKNDYSC
jgi:hypothetical protein